MLRLHTHLAETLDEEHSCLERFGKRPLQLLDDLGWIAPDVWIAHGIYFDDAEVARLGETSTGIAHCPSSNSRLGSGIARVVDLTAAGAPVGLGVDGVASNEIGTLFPEMRMALFLARQRDSRRRRSRLPTRWHWPPRAAPGVLAATTSAASSPATRPTWSFGRATTRLTSSTRSPGWCWARSGPPGTSSSTARRRA